MTPDQISAATTFLALIEKLGGAPLYVIIMIVILGPWMASFFFDRSNTKRFEATKKMYEDNVILVKDYNKIADVLMECVVMNTIKWTEVSDQIKSNQFCPLNRIRKVRMEDVPQ